MNNDSTYEGPERRASDWEADTVEPVVLTRKLADVIDGVDLVGKEVGDRIPLSRHEATLLIAEGWAVLAESRRMHDTAQPVSHPDYELGG